MVFFQQLKISLLLFFLFSLSGLKAQNIITGTVTDPTNNPVPFATVYLSNTTIGTLANSNGIYTLTIPQDGDYELVISCIGFTTSTKTIHTEGKLQTMNIRLKANIIEIEEVIVSVKDKNRVKSYEQFYRLFIGESPFAQSCRILNEEDLRLYHDVQDNIVKGYSTKSLRIENKALGYLITYDLTDFSYNQKSKILKFSGSQYFQPLTGNSKKIEKWESNRLTAYYGSKMNFLRALCADSLTSGNFRMYECSINPGTDEYSMIKPLQVKDIRMSSDKNSSTFFYAKPILVVYIEKHAAMPDGLYGFPPEELKSTIIFSKPLKVYKNGRPADPYAVTWSGKMVNERISDMLPFDYKPVVKFK